LAGLVLIPRTRFESGNELRVQAERGHPVADLRAWCRSIDSSTHLLERSAVLRGQAGQIFVNGMRLRRHEHCPCTTGRRPEDLVLLDLPKALGSRQCTVDGEPLVRVSEVREVKPAEAGQRHPRVPDDEIVFRPAASGAVSNVEVEGLAAPRRERGDRVVEGTGILRTQFEEPRKLRG
jgi:hypothetical protein